MATQEAAELTERVAAAARRTGDLRELATATGRPTPTAAAGIADHSTTTAAQAAQRVRLLGANNAAAAYFAAQYRSSWAPGYLQ